MVLGQYRCAVGTLTTRLEAEQVLKELKQAGVPISQISIVPVASNNAVLKQELSGIEFNDDVEDNSQSPAETTAKAGAIVGTLLGAIAGCMAGLSLLLVPEAGFLIVVGAWGMPLLTTVAGAGIGAASCGVIGAVAGKEAPENKTGVDEEGNSSREYLVVVEGTDEEVHQVESILSRLNRKYFKTNLPSLSEPFIVDWFKTPGLWKSL